MIEGSLYEVHVLVKYLMHRSCIPSVNNGTDNDSNMTSNATGFEVLPGLYGVLAATGLIFSVVITLICCTMILAHGK